MLLLKNGHIIDPSNNLDQVLDILIKDGRIVKISQNIPPSGETQVKDLRSLVVTPGLIDCHVHFRDFKESHKETIETGSRAAAIGGFTTVICEPNTQPLIDSLDQIDALQQKCRNAFVNIYTKACITLGMRGEKLVDIASIGRQHNFVKAITDDGHPVISKRLMEEACKQAKDANLIIACHSEDSEFIPKEITIKIDEYKEIARLSAEDEKGINEFFTNMVGFELFDIVIKNNRVHFQTKYTNEAEFIKRDVNIAKKFGTRLHISHVSQKDSIACLEQARKEGVEVTCEVTPHHLLLNKEDYKDISVNPPLRSKKDVETVQEALSSGLIDAIASDHAPHSEEDKNAGVPGLIGLETTLGLILTKFVKPGIISLKDAIKKMSTNPAGIFELPGGTLEVGMPANITVIDLNKKWTVDTTKFESKSRNCPFEGWQLEGKAVMTIVNGSIVMENERIISRPIQLLPTTWIPQSFSKGVQKIPELVF